MTTLLDLPNYLDRIRWRDQLVVDRRTLSALLRAHMATIPFENLDVLLRRPIGLDLASLQRKLVDARRGGYCFEQATLFAAALDALGFAPVRHLARVILAKPRESAPRTHMFVTVSLADGVFVVDPGFGALAPRMPLPLVSGATMQADGETNWMQRDADRWTMRALRDGEPVDCWTSTMEQAYPVDFEMGNHFTSTYPGSQFVERILMRAITPGGRVTLMNRDVTIRDGGQVRRLQLRDRAELRSLVHEHFGFDLPELATLRVPSIPQWT